ncbi:hypothetical protein [Ruminococcus flavefaciens]|uniref:hypothetical protein n=1 Tax=Ruminococcus flavefaciens TaxID=1265 RepID=UPI0003058112|nr:hypothetical protein [Ruminococcus flavefaciens]
MNKKLTAGIVALFVAATISGTTQPIFNIGFANSSIVASAADSIPQASYIAHVQSKGWLSYVSGGETAGTTGDSLRLEALRIRFDGVRYQAHVQSKGWGDWVDSDDPVGTVNEKKAIEAVRIKLTDDMAKKYDIYYRLHVAHYGWLGWAKNGEPAGTTGGRVRAEAIQIKVVKRNASFDRGTQKPYMELTLPETNTITKADIQAVCNKYGYANNKYWTTNGSTYFTSCKTPAYASNNRGAVNGWNSFSYRGCSQCYGFADYVMANVASNKKGTTVEIDGQQNSWAYGSVHNGFKKLSGSTAGTLKIGDIVRAGNKNTTGVDQHSAIVYDIDANGNATFLEVWGASGQISFSSRFGGWSYGPRTLSEFNNFGINYILRYEG